VFRNARWDFLIASSDGKSILTVDLLAANYSTPTTAETFASPRCAAAKTARHALGSSPRHTGNGFARIRLPYIAPCERALH